MFDGEFASLKAIEETGRIKVPHPIAVLDSPDKCGAMLVMEHLDLKHCSDQGTLGTQLAKYTILLTLFLRNMLKIDSRSRGRRRVGSMKSTFSEDVHEQLKYEI